VGNAAIEFEPAAKSKSVPGFPWAHVGLDVNQLLNLAAVRALRVILPRALDRGVATRK
jgi:hypothetical protein